MHDMALNSSSDSSKSNSGLRLLITLGFVSWLIYAAFSWLSRSFGYETPGPERPILAVLALLAIAFVCYLLALRAAMRASGHRDLVTAIWVFAVAFRATLLFTEPFQEIDIYRYIWDGQVTASGVSPYRYSPSQVRSTDARDRLPQDIQRLVALRDSDPQIATMLSRIHYGDLTTVYPPVSQAVFAVGAATTPGGATVRTHLAVMKLWITAFDLLTLFLLIRILRHVGKPVGWAVAYGWCPLVVKEFANSGHLDSIAVCLTTASLYFTMKAFFPREAVAPNRADDNGKRSGKTTLDTILAAVFMGLAIAAKLYPVVLTPLLFLTAIRRGSWRVAVAAGLVASVISACALIPMFLIDRSRDATTQADASFTVDHSAPESSTPDSGPPLPRKPSAAATKAKMRPPVSSADGLAAFLSRWKMNDFLFQLVESNVSIRTGNERDPRPWFAVTAVSWRESTIRMTRRLWGVVSANEITDGQAAFFFARLLTGLTFLILAFWFAYQTPRETRPERFLELIFLTLAWFWLLQPTQNPWYWIWALPLVPFARGGTWLAMSGLVLGYYSRFWFVHHCSGVEVLHTPYRGVDFFDNVVVWLEYAPWFVWLATAYLMRCRRRGAPDSQ